VRILSNSRVVRSWLNDSTDHYYNETFDYITNAIAEYDILYEDSHSGSEDTSEDSNTC